MSIPAAPVVTLTNGLRVANFSSPHPFSFVDGTVLERCDPDRVKVLALNTSELVERSSDGRWNDISIAWRLTLDVEQALTVLQRNPDVDIILVPLPVMTAIKEQPLADTAFLWSKVRVIRVADRETKAIHIDRFCV
jgi:hypothetical protein